MPEKLLIPSIDNRIGTLLEFNRRRDVAAESRSQSATAKPTITISREFGCEAYPMAECLRELLEKKTSDRWLLMDKALLEEVARNHNLSEQLIKGLGEKSRFLDEILSTFSPRWKTEKDYFRLLCKQIVALAEQGNVILMGRGSAFITHSMKNCHHFRLFASADFKNRSIAKRLGVPLEEAEKLVKSKQKQRDSFIHDFLDRDANDLSVYNLIFNNDRNTPKKIAETIATYILTP